MCTCGRASLGVLKAKETRGLAGQKKKPFSLRQDKEIFTDCPENLSAQSGLKSLLPPLKFNSLSFKKQGLVTCDDFEQSCTQLRPMTIDLQQPTQSNGVPIGVSKCLRKQAFENDENALVRGSLCLRKFGDSASDIGCFTRPHIRGRSSKFGSSPILKMFCRTKLSPLCRSTITMKI